MAVTGARGLPLLPEGLKGHFLLHKRRSALEQRGTREVRRDERNFCLFRSPGERVSPHGSDHIELKAAYNRHDNPLV